MCSSQIDIIPHSVVDELVHCTYPGCVQTFRSRFSCKRHQLIHTKEKRFVCKQCGRGFSFAQHLREHSYRHTNQRPYKCGINNCTRTFRHSSELSLHRRTHPEYRLKKYHYAEKTKSNKGLSKETITQYKRPCASQTIDCNAESLESKKRMIMSLEDNQSDSNINLLDMTFLQFIQNITTQKDEVERVRLPIPDAKWGIKGLQL